MLLLFVVAAVAVERASRGEAKTYENARARTGAVRAPPELRGVRAWIATAVCAIPLLAGFVIPVLLLLRLMGTESDPGLTARYALWSYNSLRVALFAAILAVAIAVFTAGMILPKREPRLPMAGSSTSAL